MKKELPFKSAPESICILRLSSVGDVCNIVPIVRTVQAYWPSTQISWVIGSLEHQLVGDIEGVEFFVCGKKNWWAAPWQMKKRMAGRRFSILLQMQASMRTSLMALHIPAYIRLGFHKKQAKDFQWLFTGPKTKFIHQPHVIDGFFSFLEAIGLPKRKLVWDIPIPEAARASAASKIPSSLKRYLIVNPCSSARFRNWRNWRAEKYAQMIDYAAERYNVASLLTGGSTALEQRYGKEICRLSRSEPVNMIGKTNLKELLALLDNASAIISPDTGPIHIANSLGIPTIGLYAGSNPLRTGPYLFQNWVVNAYPEAVRNQFRKSVDEIDWGKRVRQPNVIDLITFDAVKEKIDKALTLPRC
ncbi:MAG: glycosyltransferase family 9 protein [Desulfobacterales bacterium]